MMPSYGSIILSRARPESATLNSIALAAVVLTLAPPVLGNLVQSAMHYVTVALLMAALLTARKQFIVHKFMVAVACLALVNGVLALRSDLYHSTIHLAFIAAGFFSYNAARKSGGMSLKSVAQLFLAIAYLQVILLYFLSDYPLTEEARGGWASAGIEYGVTKSILSFFAGVSYLWLLLNRRVYHLIAFLIVFSPLFLVTRMVSFSLVLCTLIHFLNQEKNRGAATFLLAWAIAIGAAVGYYLLGKFDRLPSYAISFDILDKTVFGLGHRQYQYYIQDNLDRLNSDYSILMSDTMTTFYTGAESMYADILACYGGLGLILLAGYNFVLVTAMRRYHAIGRSERWIVLIWAFFMFCGIAQDMTQANFLFYGVLGGILAISENYNQATARRLSVASC